YYGSVGAGCSFYKVLEGSYPVQAFKGNIVLIGAYASGTQDNYYSAIDKETQMYGVEIHANIVNQLLDGVYKKELVFPYNLISTILMGIFTIVIVSLFRNQISIPLIVILSGAYVYLSKLFYDKLNIVVAILTPVISALLIMIVHILLSYFTVHREKQRIIANYGKYLSPEVARQIADMGEAALSLGGIKKDIAVLFVDIRGFTPLSESLPPEKVMEMLNSYLKITTSAIFKYEGTVDKFIGDATMGVFNAPLDLEDYTYKAVMAGLEMAKMSKTIDETLPDDLKGRVGFGVGINCGEAIVGNVGTDFRMEYTAIGDTVNTASRLEGQAKSGTVIISQAVYERVKDRLICEDAGKVTLKGKAEEAQIYRVLGEK
ncbi:MAG: adenylate/guanylate cyclase domain-containing protein, partial [Erysipelotrichaceae bacterium]|nr:adenylate/guanylate cyclase domain-containing protein [Erysipelotrichaceae bacterium]